jgi:hypothetical protein
MKKLIGILSIIIALSSTVVAQSDSAHSGQAVLNPVVGFNFSSLSNEPNGFQSEARLGWHFGGNLRLGDKVFLQPGLQIMKIGSRLRSGDDLNPFNEDNFQTDITVLRIPILAGIRFLPPSSAFNGNIHGGIATNIILSVDEQKNLLTEDDFNSAIYSVVVGAGVDILFLTLDVDYELGLTNVFKKTGFFDSDAKNNAIIVSLGGRFAF